MLSAAWSCSPLCYHELRDGPLENLWGGGGAVNPKKKTYKEFGNEKNSCGSKIQLSRHSSVMEEVSVRSNKQYQKVFRAMPMTW